jgi:ferric-dicitrate binding protein FerR (iron transport regulator)
MSNAPIAAVDHHQMASRWVSSLVALEIKAARRLRAHQLPHHAARNKEAVEIVRSLLRHRAKPNVRLSPKKPTVAASGILLRGATLLALVLRSITSMLGAWWRRPSVRCSTSPRWDWLR